MQTQRANTYTFLPYPQPLFYLAVNVYLQLLDYLINEKNENLPHNILSFLATFNFILNVPENVFAQI